MQTLTWYRHRLGRMGPAELLVRTRRTLRLPGDLLRARVAPPARVLAGATVASPPLLQGGAGIAAAPYVAAADRLAQGALEVFGREVFLGAVPDWNRDPKSGVRAPRELGPVLDYRDARKVGDIKYLWEPNRHLHLVRLAQAYRLTGQAGYLNVVRHHVQTWLQQCPYLRGPNWASSLELAIRLINWSLVWELAGGAGGPLFAGREGARLQEEWLQSIYRHLSFIAANFSRYSSANNHLIGEAAGLYVGALSWPQWKDCARFVAQGQAILEEQARLQITPEGVPREQAFAYAQFVFDFLLLAALKGRAADLAFSPAYWQRLERMLEFIAALMDSAGHVPQVGDADDGYVVSLAPQPGFCAFRSLLATGAVLFRRPEFKLKSGGLDDKTRWLFGPEAGQVYAELEQPAGPLALPRAFPEGGYYILGAELDTPDEVRLLMDAGPLGYLSLAAHGHADALSILLGIHGRQILVDPGTYAYHTQPRWRAWFRGTAAHNTVCIDGLDQSVPGGNFMWVRHAAAQCVDWRSSAQEDRVVGVHHGYERLSDPVVHRRAVRLLKPRREIEVIDMLFCARRHTAVRWWHFAEDCHVHLEDDGGAVRIESGDVRVRMLPGEAVSARLLRGAEDPPGGWISRRFDAKQPTTSLAWETPIRGTTVLRTRIHYS